MHLFLTTVAFMHKHFKRQWFTNNAKYFPTLSARNGDHLLTVCVAC